MDIHKSISVYQRNITIKRKFSLLIAIILINFLLAGAITYYIYGKIIDIEKSKIEVTELKHTYSQLFDAEKDFYLSYINDNEFFNTGYSPKLQKHKTILVEAGQRMEAIKLKLGNKDSEVNTLISEIQQSTDKYGQIFQQLADINKEIGYRDQGLIGRMRERLTSALDYTQNPNVKNKLMAIREAEVEFNEKNDLIYAEKVYIKYREFKDLLITDTVSSRLFIAAKEYYRYFTLLLSYKQQAGFTNRGGLKYQINQYTERILPKLNSIDNILDAKKSNIYYTLIATLVLFVLIIIFVIPYFSKLILNGILTSLKALKDYLHQLGKGELPEKDIEFLHRDEIQETGYEVNNLIAGLRRTRDFAKAIGQGELNVSYVPLSEGDDIGNSLLEMRQSLIVADEQGKKRREEEEKQNWATKGFAMMSDILRKDNDNIDQLSYNVLSTLVRYLDANQGVIYIVNDLDKSDIHLEIKSIFAYNRRKFSSKRINWGDGIIGRCALEQETIYMTEVPDEYVEIKSGIGQANPRAILIVPLVSNKQIYGIVEMAGFIQFEQYKIKFVEQVAESVAATIASVRINMQTSRLLQESKMQAEELAAKEEEMRQNMEELQATQEEAARKEAEATGFVSAVNHSIIRADFQLDGLLSYANTKFLKMMEYQSAEVVGQPVQKFIMDNDIQDFEAQWRRVCNGGKHIEQEMRLKTKVSHRWFLVTFTPIRDLDGNVIRILYLAIDIEEQKLRNLDYEGELKAIHRSVLQAEFRPDGGIISTNEVFRHRFGYTSEQVKDKNVFFFIKDEEIAEFQSLWHKIAGGLTYAGQMRRLTKDGEEIWLQGTYSAVKNYSGHVYKIVFIASDITEQKKQEQVNKQLLEEAKRMAQELSQQEQYMRKSMDEMRATQVELAKKEAEMSGQLYAINRANIVVEYGLDGTIIRVNDNFCDLLGYVQSDVLNRNHRMFADNETRNSDGYRRFWENLRKGIYQEGEVMRVAKNGNQVYLKEVYNPILDSEGKPYKILEIALDITESKTKEAEIRGQIDAINKTNILMEFNLDGSIISSNKMFCELTGFEEQELIGKQFRILLDPDYRRSEEFKDFWTNLVNGIAQDGEFKYFRRDGQAVYIKAVFNPILDISGKPIRILKLAFDVTEMKKQQQMLEENAKRLSESEEVLRSALNVAKEKEVELREKSEQIEASEEEMRQSLEYLQAIQDEMEVNQNELEEAKAQLEENAKQLNEAVEQLQFKEKELSEKNQALIASEEELRQNLEELQTIQDEMERKQKELEVAVKQGRQNEQVLGKALTKSKEKEELYLKKETEFQQHEMDLQQKLQDTVGMLEKLQKENKELIANQQDIEQNRAQEIKTWISQVNDLNYKLVEAEKEILRKSKEIDELKKKK